MDATTSMLRALKRQRTTLRELQEAGANHGADVRSITRGVFHVNGPWLAVHRTCMEAEGHLGVDVVMGVEVEPNTYEVRSM